MGDVLNPLQGEAEAECQEESNFYRMISGMHSNIAALSSEYFYRGTYRNPVDPSTSTKGVPKPYNPLWSFSLSFFREKLARHQDRIQNLYFTFSLLLRTVCHVAPVLQECTCATGSAKEDLSSRADLFFLLNQSFASCEAQYMEEPIFQRKFSLAVRQFENITRILDCVECEKCRLHGKIKMAALQVALRASGTASPVTSLERNEVTALINALAYFADSILVINKMELRLFCLQCGWIAAISIIVSTLVLDTIRLRGGKRAE